MENGKGERKHGSGFWGFGNVWGDQLEQFGADALGQRLGAQRAGGAGAGGVDGGQFAGGGEFDRAGAGDAPDFEAVAHAGAADGENPETGFDLVTKAQRGLELGASRGARPAAFAARLEGNYRDVVFAQEGQFGGFHPEEDVGKMDDARLVGFVELDGAADGKSGRGRSHERGSRRFIIGNGVGREDGKWFEEWKVENGKKSG